jgi:site-specific recombinase XerC
MTSNVITLAGARVHPVTIEQATQHFLARLQLRGARPNTLVSYGVALRDFAEFAQATQGIRLIGLTGARMVERWLDRLAHRGLCARSQAQKLSVLRGLVRHSRIEGWLDHDPSKDAHVRTRIKRVIAPEREPLLAMIDAIPAHGALQLRDRAMLRLTFDTALRVGEVIGLDLFDPRHTPRSYLDARRLMVQVVGKGGDDEQVGINARTLEYIEAWLAVRGELAHADERALFVSNRGRRITRQMAHYRIKAWGAAVGLPRMHYHLLRHRRIGDVIDRAGLDAGQRMARHANRATTANIYGAHADEILRHQIRTQCDLDTGGAPADEGRAAA